MATTPRNKTKPLEPNAPLRSRRASTITPLLPLHYKLLPFVDKPNLNFMKMFKEHWLSMLETRPRACNMDDLICNIYLQCSQRYGNKFEKYWRDVISFNPINSTSTGYKKTCSSQFQINDMVELCEMFIDTCLHYFIYILHQGGYIIRKGPGYIRVECPTWSLHESWKEKDQRFYLSIRLHEAFIVSKDGGGSMLLPHISASRHNGHHITIYDGKVNNKNEQVLWFIYDELKKAQKNAIPLTFFMKPSPDALQGNTSLIVITNAIGTSEVLKNAFTKTPSQQKAKRPHIALQRRII